MGCAINGLGHLGEYEAIRNEDTGVVEVSSRQPTVKKGSIHSIEQSTEYTTREAGSTAGSST
jgi:hypothetical protein